MEMADVSKLSEISRISIAAEEMARLTAELSQIEKGFAALGDMGVQAGGAVGQSAAVPLRNDTASNKKAPGREFKMPTGGGYE